MEINVDNDRTYPKLCACCSKGIINEEYDICSFCGWEDDWVQNSDESFPGGANKLCLKDYRNIFFNNEFDLWVPHYNIDILEETGLVRAFYTTTRNPAWKYGKDGSRENCERLSKTFNIPLENMIMLNQTHTNGVRIVSKKEAGEMVIKPITVDGNDGMVTNEPGLMLGTVEADCVPIYLLDPVNEAIGMVHSGWRGTANLIGNNAVLAMKEQYGSDPKDIMVVIGPCICKDCYEVGKELIEDFGINYSDEEINQFFFERENGKYSLDLREAICISLCKVGVLRSNIHDIGICTFESEDLCSWRRDKPVMRSMLTGIMLRDM